MKIEYLTPASDIEGIARFAHRQNVAAHQASSFMYKDFAKALDSFKAALASDSAQIAAFIDGKCVGYIQVVNEADYIPGDIVGPFFEGDDEEIAVALLRAAREAIDDAMVMKFNIGHANPLNGLLPRIGAARTEHNYAMRLERADFMRAPTGRVVLERHDTSRDEFVKTLYEAEFPDSYMDTAALLDHDEAKYVLSDILSEGQPVGFAFYRPLTGYIDFLAIDGPYRGRGLGRDALSSVVERQLAGGGVDRVELNVDIARESALSLYRSLGFALAEHFIAYEVKAGDLRC